MNAAGPNNLINRLRAPLCLQPKIRVKDGRLVVWSSWFQQLLGLFSYRKEMMVDPEVCTVLVKRRMFWFWRTVREIPFGRIRRIDYGFSDTGGDIFRATIEFYTISLILIVPDEEIKLFSFVGEYSAPATWTDVMLYGEEALYWGSEGGQSASSQEFVQLLKHFTGAPLV